MSQQDPNRHDAYKEARLEAELELEELKPKLKQMKARALSLARAIECLYWLETNNFHPDINELDDFKKSLGKVTFERPK